MPRSTVFQAESVTIDKTPFLAIVKYLRAESGELERAKGGLWVPLDGDVDKTLALLTNAAEQAMAFAVACESKHAEIIRASEPKAAPKAAPKKPTPPPAAPKVLAPAESERAIATRLAAPISPAVAANRAIALQAAPKAIIEDAISEMAAPTPAHTPERAKVIAKAREDRAKLATNGVAQVGATVRDTGKPAAPKLSPEEQAEADWLRLLGA